jgi:hypothetical protein
VHRDLDEDDLARIVGSAERNRQNAIGSRHPEAPGFEAVEIDERRHGQANTNNLMTGFAAARAYIDALLDDDVVPLHRDIAAVETASGLRKYDLPTDECFDLIQYWSFTKYGTTLDNAALVRAVEEAAQMAAVMPSAPTHALRPAENAAPSTGGRIFKEAWGEPADLWADAPAPAALPLDAVPEVVSRWAQDQARRLGVALGAPAAAIITTLGSLIPANNQQQMRQKNPDWKVRPILWTAIIGESGKNKSATINAAIEPVKTIERAWRRQHAAKMRVYQATRTVTKKERPSRTSVNCTSSEEEQLSNPKTGDAVFTDCSPSDPPKFRQKIANDATTEALAKLLADNNPSGLLYYVDELAGLFGSMDAYRQKGGKDRPFWLQAKEGSEYIVNRKTSDRIVVENCAISVLGGIQPDKIKKLAAGLAEDGLLQRFAPIFIERLGPGEDFDADTELNEIVEQVAAGIVESTNSAVFKFAPEADVERSEIEVFKDAELARTDATPFLRQWLDKLPNEFGRASLVFHFIESHAAGSAPPCLVSRDTAHRARRYLTEFVYSHARAFSRQVSAASWAGERAEWIAGFILARELSAIDRRQIYRSYAALRDRRHEIPHVMCDLELLDWVRPTKYDGKQVPTAWAINPMVHDGRFAAVAEAQRTRRTEFVERIPQDAKTTGAA